jgi:Tfp pilus assembly protein PilE
MEPKQVTFLVVLSAVCVVSLLIIASIIYTSWRETKRHDRLKQAEDGKPGKIDTDFV